jgi:hypothetical protein
MVVGYDKKMALPQFAGFLSNLQKNRRGAPVD